MLKHRGVKHHVLNAKFHEKEAEIIALAGQKGAVTIATNMAGRGTDIVLGGSPDALFKQRILYKNEDLTEEQMKAAYEKIKAECEANKEEVVAAGGVHIIGTERHESRRIDNQLRGRAGRQGDPGSSRFFLSLQDDLMRIFASERVSNLMLKLGMEEGVPIEHGMVTKSIENAQKKVEGHNFEIRKHLLEYDDVMNKQREVHLSAPGGRVRRGGPLRRNPGYDRRGDGNIGGYLLSGRTICRGMGFVRLCRNPAWPICAQCLSAGGIKRNGSGGVVG